MMKLGVLHINSAAADATSPTMRIARYAAKALPAPLVHNVETAAKYRDTKFDVLFVKLGVLKFSNHRDDAMRIIERAKRVINLENDYAFKPDPRIRKLHPNMAAWGTVPDNCKATGGAYVNWNVLTWLYPRPWADRLKAYRPVPNRLLYYGAFRPDRLESFKYWLSDPAYEVVVGARSTHRAKFSALGDHIKVENFRTPDALAQLRGTAIYLEDKTSHDLYCSLANRFYECLQLGIPMVFDAKCFKTLEAAALLPKAHEFIVQNTSELEHLLEEPDKIAAKQRRLWYEDFDAVLAQQFAQAVKTLKA